MPQLKQPKSLYQYCKTAVNLLITRICKIIEEENGSYCNADCQRITRTFQQYLLSNVPGHVLDDLCNSTAVRNKGFCISVEPLNQTCSPEIELLRLDLRILLSVYIHRNMRKFSVNLHLPNDDGFWIQRVNSLSKIIVLDLRMACTDEILEVVGKNCRLLEEINILSKSESCENSNHSLNALKLKYFISDDGLRHLCNCKNLRKIVMNKMLRPQCGGRMMTHSGIKDVIKSLPKLQYITYTDVGTIVNRLALADEVKTLSLTHINDYHSKPSHIRSISKLCPKLRELCLNKLSSTDRRVASDIVQELADSDLKLTVLEITFFPPGKSFENFLKVKGAYLSSLSLWSAEPVSSNELLLIGRHCPNLENVHLKELTPNSNDNENLYLSSRQPMLTLLRCLYLSGKCWSPHIIVPLCLRHATRLINLCLVNSDYSDLMDDTINKVLQVNSLSKVKYICLFSGCLITFDTITKLISTCPRLMHLSAWKHPRLDHQDVTNLMLELQRKNINIELMCSSY